MSPKADDDQMMGMTDNTKKQGQKQLIRADIEWEKYISGFSKVPRETLLPAICKLLLQTPATNISGIIEKHTDLSGRENFIRTATIRLMSTPEYQLC